LRTLLAECKAKIKNLEAFKRLSGLVLTLDAPTLQRFRVLFALERQYLSTAVIAARWTGNVRRDAASALGTFVQLRGMPAICRFARA